jgi:hypothetical protein
MIGDIMRFEDTPELFGQGCGISTSGDIKCNICGVKYNEGADKNEYYYDSVGYTDFAGVNICDCCFEKIEEEIWVRRTEVISWLKRRLDNIKKRNDKELELINTIKE